MNKIQSFQDVIDNSALLKALADLGYETPTPIQAQSISVLMEGVDLIAQAQTGTGKTAAFALPVLSGLDLSVRKPQALIMAPTRELAIQVAEAFKKYAKHLKDFQVTPIYGGQDYQVQLRALKRGSHVIVGTPGRVMDHMRRKTLDVSALKSVVLDEGDEMLRMGFVDDIEWILQQIPQDHQTALFSATMPTSIQNIAKRHLKNPQKIQIKMKTGTVDSIEQRCVFTTNNQKADVLIRFLQTEEFDAAIIFSRTKAGTMELTEKLQSCGYKADALNGDIKQAHREKAINRLKKGSLDIIVATDVAARGIDVERITHVFNYDMPSDAESYVHRVGRTGRAGRKGKAFLFVGPREKRSLADVERTINKQITVIDPPTVAEMMERRNAQLATKVGDILAKSKKLKPYRKMVESLLETIDHSAEDIAAALAYLIEQDNPIDVTDIPTAKPDRPTRNGGGGRRSSSRGERGRGDKSGGDRKRFSKKRSDSKGNDAKGSDRKRSAPKGSDKKRTDKKRTDKKRTDKKPRSKSKSTKKPGKSKKSAS